MGQTIAESIYEEGRLEGKLEAMQQAILRLGQVRFGMPDETTQSFIHGIKAIDELEIIADRILCANDWLDLLNLSQCHPDQCIIVA